MTPTDYNRKFIMGSAELRAHFDREWRKIDLQWWHEDARMAELLRANLRNEIKELYARGHAGHYLIAV